MWQTNARIAVTFAEQSLSESIPKALIVLGITTAGLVAAFIFYKVGECIAYKPRKHRQHEEKLIEEMKSRSRWRRGAIIRVFFALLAWASILVGLTIGFNAAGFNFWTVAFGGGIVTFVLTYSFGSSIQSAMAYFLINISEKVEDEWWIELEGTNVKGYVVAIHILWVELEFTDPSGRVKLYQVPTHMVINNIISQTVGSLQQPDLPKKKDNSSESKGIRHRLVAEDLV